MAFSDPAGSSLRPAIWRQVANVCVCILLASILFGYVRRRVFFFPITLETIWQIGLAERNRQKSKQRVRALRQQLVFPDLEKLPATPATWSRCVASVVGYREEPNLFAKCLESYKGCPGLEILLVGIDGHEAQDMEMAHVVQKVYPDQTVFVRLDEPLAHMAVRLAEEYVSRELSMLGQPGMPEGWTFGDLPTELRHEATDFAMDRVYARATETLRAHQVLDSATGAARVICVYQPHISKKGIMFTNLVFSTVLGKANHIPYLWTSDSDTWVTPDTIPLTIGCMVSDPKMGGSCSTLGIHNAGDSTIAHLGAAIYWSELAITRGQTGAIDAVDCQPGPCATFRLDALSPILFAWYTQTSMGVKTIVNEDRHLTTKLLLAGWKVTFNTEAIAFTDTPTTLLRWLLQQVRWARANQIETFQYPLVYAIHGPVLFLTAMNRFYGPLSVLVAVIRYAIHGDTGGRAYSLVDILLRVMICTAYNYHTNRRHVCNLAFLAVSQIFYQLPLPGIIVYATATALEGGWGTSMRNRKETQKARNVGPWEHWKSIAAITAWMGFVAAALTRWLATTYLPAWRLPLMGCATLNVIVGLGWALLRRPQKS